MNKILSAAAAAVVVIATIITVLAVIAEPTRAQIAGLGVLVIAELYAFGVVFYARWSRRGDANNFIPAVLAAIAPLIVSVVVLTVSPNTIVTTVLHVIAWAIALIALFVSLAANHVEATRGEDAPDARDLTAKPGKA